MKKGGGKAAPRRLQQQKTASSTPEQPAALKEAAQLWQSLRLSKVNLEQLQRLSDPAGKRGLMVATGECKLHVNSAGTLLRERPVAPVVGGNPAEAWIHHVVVGDRLLHRPPEAWETWS